MSKSCSGQLHGTSLDTLKAGSHHVSLPMQENVSRTSNVVPISLQLTHVLKPSCAALPTCLKLCSQEQEISRRVWGSHVLKLSLSGVLQTVAFLEMLGLPYNLDHRESPQALAGSASAGMLARLAMSQSAPCEKSSHVAWHLLQ